MITFHRNLCRYGEILLYKANHEGESLLKNFMENEAFCLGVSLGINLHQDKVVMAAKKKEPIKIGDELYYVQNARDRLQEMIDRVCR